MSEALKQQRQRRLKDYRDDHNLTVDALGKSLAMTARKIQGIAAEDRSRFKLPEQEKLLTRIGVSRAHWYDTDSL